MRVPLPVLHARVTYFGEIIRRRVGFTLRAFHSLYPFLLSLSISLSYLSLPLYISPSLSISLLLPFFPSLSSLLLSLFSLSSLSLLSIILFGVSNGRFRPCFLQFCYFALKKFKKKNYFLIFCAIWILKVRNLCRISSL